MFCNKCGKEINNDVTFCPYCGARVEEKSAFEPYGQDYNYNSAQQPVQQPVQQPAQQQYQQYQQFQQNFNAQIYAMKEISSARTFGILSIILGVLGINLFGWIFGGIGLSKANRYLYSPDLQIQLAAQEAKKLNTIGLIVTSVIFAIAFIIGIIAVIGAFGMAEYYYYY